MEGRITYTDCKEKQLVRASIFNNVDLTGKTIVGLPGPDLKEYTRFFRRRGVKHFHLYENDRANFKLQLPDLLSMKRKDVSFHFADVIEANPYYHNYIYDIDLCATIRKSSLIVNAFMVNFVFTFTRRDFTRKHEKNPLLKQLDWFCVARNERFRSFKDDIIETTLNKYRIFLYTNTKEGRQGGCPMITITDLI